MNNKYLKGLAMVFAILASQLVSAQCSIPITYIQETTCQGTPYDFNGTNLDSAGTYNDTIQGTAGCDSIVQLQLFLIPIVYTNVYDTVCQGQSFVWSANGNTYTTAGTYGDTLFQAVTFCDSVILLHLATRPSNNDTFVINATYCTTAGGGGGPRGYNFFWN